MKLDWLVPLIGIGAAGYAFWYYWYYCVRGRSDQTCIAIYPPPAECYVPPNLPFYLPRPPFLPAPEECGFPCGCQQPRQCLAYPLCVKGFVNNPLTCGCTPECEIVQKGSSIICHHGTRFNWCTKSCIPVGSLAPDCAAPRCAA